MKRTSLYVLLASTLWSCDTPEDKTLVCPDFQVTKENYWFPLSEGGQVAFQKQGTTMRKVFTVAKKHVIHRDEAPNCYCYDYSEMLLTTGSDSLFLYCYVTFVGTVPDRSEEHMDFRIANNRAQFLEASWTKVNDYSLNGVAIADVESADCTECQNNLSVKRTFRAKNMGIIRFELMNGDVWVNENLTKTGTTTVESFDIDGNNICL